MREDTNNEDEEDEFDPNEVMKKKQKNATGCIDLFNLGRICSRTHFFRL